MAIASGTASAMSLPMPPAHPGKTGAYQQKAGRPVSFRRDQRLGGNLLRGRGAGEPAFAGFRLCVDGVQALAVQQSDAVAPPARSTKAYRSE